MSGTVTSSTFPIVLTAAGAQPTPPATLLSQLVTSAAALSPGLTSNLPGSLIEDMGSTATGAVVVMNQAQVDLINSITPYGANAFLLTALGALYGVPQGVNANTSVYVVFSANAPGVIIQPGFIVSDGTYQYTVTDGGVVGATLQTQPLFALATQSGSWAIPSGTVTKIVTSVPSTITLTVTNPLAGTPSPGPQTEEDYRAQVLQAGLVSSQGQPLYLKTLLNLVQGVQSNLISIRQQPTGWEVIVGGSGDPYQIAYAIYQSIDISTLVGSTLAITGITNANPGVITTSLNHGYGAAGATQVINITGVTGLSGVNNVSLTATVITATTFSIGINTTNSGTYTGGGVVTPNFRNVSQNLYDYPDVYTVPFVLPPLQSVTMVVTWNTIQTALVSNTTIASLAQPALANYVTGLPVGQPMNLFELQATFQTATASVIPNAVLTRMVFAVSINGVGVAPTAGTGIIQGDPESYFSTTAEAITVNQG